MHIPHPTCTYYIQDCCDVIYTHDYYYNLLTQSSDSLAVVFVYDWLGL